MIGLMGLLATAAGAIAYGIHDDLKKFDQAIRARQSESIGTYSGIAVSYAEACRIATMFYAIEDERGERRFAKEYPDESYHTLDLKGRNHDEEWRSKGWHEDNEIQDKYGDCKDVYASLPRHYGVARDAHNEANAYMLSHYTNGVAVEDFAKFEGQKLAQSCGRTPFYATREDFMVHVPMREQLLDYYIEYDRRQED